MTLPVSSVEALPLFTAVDCSPSRARLGRVAEMLREAESALPVSTRLEPRVGAVLPLTSRRPRPALPMPRAAADDPARNA